MKANKINFEELKETIKQSTKETKIYIGCDSKQLKGRSKYTTVVVVHFNGNAGGRVFRETDYINRVIGLKERLIGEIERATKFATKLIELDVLDGRELSIHLDINQDEKHQSSKMLKVAKGWVEGLGLKPVFKPDAFAASCVADKYVRQNVI